VNRASIWSGTAASWVDLHPAGASTSYALAIQGGQQAGAAEVGGVRSASLWSGTAASWVNLNPAGSADSIAYGAFAGQQAGYATFGGVAHAGLWSGNAATWEDLSVFLTGSWGDSIAQSIWSDGTTTYVAGFGFNNNTSRDEALLWTRTVPAPSAAALLSLAGLIATRRRR
jgi:hypothetical protein